MLYEEFVQKIKKAKLLFCYMIMDEIYTFVRQKRKRIYIWTAIAVTSTNRYFYFYFLSSHKGSGALFHFRDDLPKVPLVYTDGHYAYNAIFGNKATMKKSKMTNVIENLNSQIRDKISYLVRRSKAHAKSFTWLDHRLAWFFVNKNLGL